MSTQVDTCESNQLFSYHFTGAKTNDWPAGPPTHLGQNRDPSGETVAARRNCHLAACLVLLVRWQVLPLALWCFHMWAWFKQKQHGSGSKMVCPPINDALGQSSILNPNSPISCLPMRTNPMCALNTQWLTPVIPAPELISDFQVSGLQESSTQQIIADVPMHFLSIDHGWHPDWIKSVRQLHESHHASHSQIFDRMSAYPPTITRHDAMHIQ